LITVQLLQSFDHTNPQFSFPAKQKKSNKTGHFFRINSIMLINCMQQSIVSESINHSTDQEIPHPSWNTKLYYNVHKNPSLLPLLSQMHPIHTLTYIHIICFSIIFLYAPATSNGSYLYVFLTKFVCISHLFHACCLPLLCHSHQFDHILNTETFKWHNASIYTWTIVLVTLAVSGALCILVQCIAINIRFLLTISGNSVIHVTDVHHT